MSNNYEGTKLLSDEIYSKLLLNIENGQWKVGEKIPSENKISLLLDVSRVSVRGALLKLKAQHLIETKVGKGSFVTSNSRGENLVIHSLDKIDLSRNEYEYVVQLRHALEFLSIDLFCEKGTEENFEVLKIALNQMQNCKGDPNKYVAADFEFHYAIIKGSNNPLFYSIFIGCKEIMVRYFTEMADCTLDSFKNAIINHTHIYNAIVDRDPENAKKIIEGTFEFNQARLKDLFKENTNENN